MTRHRTLRLAFIAATCLVAPLAIAAPASAAVAVSLSQQISLVDGNVIDVRVAGVPAAQGVYIQQCYRPEIGQRAATGLKCNGSLQATDVMIWATMDGARGSQSAASTLKFTVRETVTAGGNTYSCGAWDCFLFVYRDHRGIMDRSLDTIVPLVFLAEQEVKVRSFGMAKDGSKVRVGASMQLRTEAMASEQGADVRVRSTTPKVCTVTPGKSVTTVRFGARGTCRLSVVAKGDSVLKPYRSTVSYTVG
jgi:hypothetical protein